MTTKRRRIRKKPSAATPILHASPADAVTGAKLDARVAVPPKEPSTRELVEPSIADIAPELGEGD